MLYQGEFLMSVLNWAGLVVNGLVAFIFPLFLTLFAYNWINKTTHGNDVNNRDSVNRGMVRYSNQEEEGDDEDDVSLDSVELEMVTYHMENEDEEDGLGDPKLDCDTDAHTHSHHTHNMDSHSHDGHVERPVIGVTGYISKLFEAQPPKTVTLFQRETVQPLSCASGACLSYREAIVKAILLLFLSVVLSNIAVDWFEGVQP
jgi:hypothetical protein